MVPALPKKLWVKTPLLALGARLNSRQGLPWREQLDGVHMVGDFAKPDDVRAHSLMVAELALGGAIAVLMPLIGLTAMLAQDGIEGAMHVDDVVAVRLLVLVVDVLGHDGDRAAARLQPRLEFG